MIFYRNNSPNYLSSSLLCRSIITTETPVEQKETQKYYSDIFFKKKYSPRKSPDFLRSAQQRCLIVATNMPVYQAERQKVQSNNARHMGCELIQTDGIVFYVNNSPDNFGLILQRRSIIATEMPVQQAEKQKVLSPDRRHMGGDIILNNSCSPFSKSWHFLLINRNKTKRGVRHKRRIVRATSQQSIGNDVILF